MTNTDKVEMTPNTIQVRVNKNGKSHVSLPVPRDCALDKLRAQLAAGGNMKKDDSFLDTSGYLIEKQHEKSQSLQDIIQSKSGIIDIRSKQSVSEKITSKLSEATPPVEEVKDIIRNLKQITHDMDPKDIKEITDKMERNLDDMLSNVPQMADFADNPLDFDEKIWNYLIIKNHLLGGLKINEDIPKRSFRKACYLNRGFPRFMYWDNSEITASSAYTQRTHNYIRSHISQQEAAASYAFVSGSMQHSKTEKATSLKEQKSLYMTGEWNFPRVIISLQPSDLDPSNGFKDAINKALKSDNGKEKYNELINVFNEYGHVFPTEVILGGQLQMIHTKVIDATVDTKAEEETLCLAVAAKFGNASASAGYKDSTSTETQTKEINELQKKNFTATGGNTLLTQNLSAWVPTLQSYKCWSVIKMSGLIPIYKLLEDKQIQEIEDLIEKNKPEEKVTFKTGDVIALLGNNGLYLSRWCSQNIAFCKQGIDPYSRFKVKVLSKKNGEESQIITLQADTNKYVSKKGDIVLIDTTKDYMDDYAIEEASKFTVEIKDPITNTIALKNGGHYVSASPKKEDKHLTLTSNIDDRCHFSVVFINPGYI